MCVVCVRLCHCVMALYHFICWWLWCASVNILPCLVSEFTYLLTDGCRKHLRQLPSLPVQLLKDIKSQRRRARMKVSVDCSLYAVDAYSCYNPALIMAYMTHLLSCRLFQYLCTVKLYSVHLVSVRRSRDSILKRVELHSTHPKFQV